MMILSLADQIARKCIHFNGIMNKTCKAGINYDDVKVDKPFKFPCLKQGGKCEHAQFRTEQEIENEVAEIENKGLEAARAMIIIKDHYEDTRESKGIIQCQCGGKLHYTIASINGHVWAKCDSCGISFNE